MPTFLHTLTHNARIPRRHLAGVASLIALALTAACGGSHSGHSGAMTGAASPSMAMDHDGGHTGMTGHSGYDGKGLSASEDGYTLKPTSTALRLGRQRLTFQVLDADGRPVTDYVEDQTKKLHLYLVRLDLTGYQHLHPELTGGTWSVDVEAAEPGPYRMYTDFIAKDAMGREHALVLSTLLTAPGSYTPAPLPAASSTTTAAGLTATVAGTIRAGEESDLRVEITADGKPVKDLQPYLDAFAHLTALRSGDAAYRHIHPEQAAEAGQLGGPTLDFEVDVPEPGDYRFFLQVQRGGELHLLPITITVAS